MRRDWWCHLLDLQRGQLFAWAPVCFGTGIGWYFALKSEPVALVWGILAVTLICGVGGLHRVAPPVRPWATAVILVLAGFAVAGVRAHTVADTVLSFRYYGPVEGRIVGIDRSASDAVRLTLDHLRLGELEPEKLPGRVRISLHGEQGHFHAVPGQVVMTTGHLSSPGGAVEPGGFDFRRHAWFQGLGASGYTNTPVLLLEEPSAAGVGLWIYQQRMVISSAVQSYMPGRVGAFAAAVTTGDRSGMELETIEALRAANLAHLLAISGLHMGMLAGFVFAVVRVLLALVPRVALFLPAKKVAAVAGMVAGAGYLALSGGNVATERAFIMAAVMFGAVLVDRRAITLRAVALAALIVLGLRPESLYGPGFQMSFAATTALVTVFGLIQGRQTGWPRWLRFAAGIALSSLVAGAATAPIAAAHFNQVPHYGLIANVVSVPVMGALVMPGAVLAAVLSPLGLGWIGLEVMRWPISWILWVADTVSNWDNALSFVVAPGPYVVPLLALGALVLVLWQGRGRFLGGLVAGGAFALWAATERPQILVSQTGGLIGALTTEGRALSKPRGDGFAADSWLENDGDPVTQARANARSVFQVDGRQRWLAIGDKVMLHATGKVASARAMDNCKAADIVVVNVAVQAPEGCLVYDLRRLRETGALAVGIDEGALTVITDRELSGRRLWSP